MLKQLESCDQIANDAIIFKHSLTCGTSSKAMAVIDELAQDYDVFMVVVQDQRELSNAVADFFQIKHESPQLIIRKAGRVAAVLNHWHIKDSCIREILAAQHSH